MKAGQNPNVEDKMIEYYDEENPETSPDSDK